MKKENLKHLFLAQYGDAEHISNVLNNHSEHFSLRDAAMYNYSATKEHISQVLNNPNEHPLVRRTAIRHPNATTEHINQVLNNPNEDIYVRAAAEQRLKDFPTK
jgi:hypothetical protein